MDVDVVTGVASFILTVLVLSYLLGDNPLYRIAVNLFVGATAGFVAIVVAEKLWSGWLMGLTLDASTDWRQRLLSLLPVILGLTLFFKLSPRMSRLGNVAVAYLVGVGVAVAINGVIVGTLLPQVRAAGDIPGVGSDFGGWVNGLIMAAGTITTLVYFQFLARRTPTGEMVRPLALRITALVGEVFIVVTLATLYAGAIIAGISIFAGMVDGFVAQLQ
jgi:hypothetical protein